MGGNIHLSYSMISQSEPSGFLLIRFLLKLSLTYILPSDNITGDQEIRGADINKKIRRDKIFICNPLDSVLINGQSYFLLKQ